jgi:TonB dependent receptor
VPTVQLDAVGKPLFANEIYDPATRAVNPANNLGYASPFPNNMIPATRFDPVTVKFLTLFQQLGATAQNANLTGNYAGLVASHRYSDIPSFKIDHNIDTKDKLSFFYQDTNTQTPLSSGLGAADGLPLEIGEYRGTYYNTRVERLNYDRTITPTLLLHLGSGMYYSRFSDKPPFTSFNGASFGISGFIQNRQFPSITGLCVGGNPCTGAGGMQTIGTSGQTQNLWHEDKPSFNANLTWVHGEHTYKIGSEVYLQGIPEILISGVTLATGTGPTSQPFTPTNSLNGYTTGFGFASFLLGDYSSTNQTPQYDFRMGYKQWALFAQDSWKITRKLTVDYGVRWDLATVPHEQYGRLGQFNMNLPNANAGGHPGATQYASTCRCPFYQPVYPYDIGPRLGVAYQINPKTVFRGGWGVVYSPVASVSAGGWAAGAVVGTNGSYPLTGINPFVNIETPIVQPTWPITDPNRYPVAGTTTGAPFMPDANQNRPPRINQWSLGIQREITRNFVMEASYVANRAVWLAGPLGFLNQISPAKYAQFGLYPYPGTGPCSSGSGVCASSSYNNNGDRALLTQSISSTAVIQAMSARGVTNLLPYSGFPTSNPCRMF